ncbi:hypothetical protein UlMin_033295 [Ulmus minor]
MESSDPFTELIPSFPDELGLECLTRLPFPVHRFASRVSRRWRALMESQEFYHHRKKKGYTHKLACLVQALSREESLISNSPKRNESPSFGLTVFDLADKSWQRLDPVPKYPSGLPLFCQVASCEGKLVVMGGLDPISYDPVTDLFVYDFATSRWRRGESMPTKRSFFAVGSHSGRVYVAGGHDENKNALDSAWVYDLRRDEWTELTRMSQGRDECVGRVVGGEFWVVSGYVTEHQGAFEPSVEVYEIETSRWRRVEGAWEGGKCPRGCVYGGKERLLSWAELDAAVGVGTCGVELGTRSLVTGSAYQGGTHGFYMVELKEGQIGKLERVSVPEEFSGCVRSGCCVEV